MADARQAGAPAALERAYRLQLAVLDTLRRASAETLAALRRLELDDASLARIAGDDALVRVRRERLAAEIAEIRDRREAIEGAARRLAGRIALFRTERAALEARLASGAALDRAGDRLAALDAALATAAHDVDAARAVLSRPALAAAPNVRSAMHDAFALEDVARRMR